MFTLKLKPILYRSNLLGTNKTSTFIEVDESSILKVVDDFIKSSNPKRPK